MGSLTKDHNLQKANPHLAKQWHPTKNGKLRPKDVTPGSNRQVWWLCNNKHEWKATVNHRNRGAQCPLCSGMRKVHSGKGKWKKPKADNPETLALVSSIRKIGETATGTVVVEMTSDEWERLCSLIPPPEDLGTAIIAYRRKHGLTQAAFADIIGHSRNWISAIERDKTIQLSYETYKRIVGTLYG